MTAAVAALLLVATAAQTPSAKPWVLKNECDWWLSREDGHSLRASIGGSSDGLVLTILDPNMADWSESERPRVVYEFDGNRRRRFTAEGWASQGGAARIGMFGVFLDRRAIRVLAGATRMRMFRDGKLVVDMPLAATPGRRELAACIPTQTGKGDSE